MRFPYIFLVFLTLLLTTASVSAAQMRFNFAYAGQTDSPQQKASRYLKRLVEQRSGNRITMNLFPIDSTGREESTIDSLKANRIQMAVQRLSKLEAINPDLQLLEMPFIFQDSRHLHRVLDGEIGAQLLLSVRQGGLNALAFWDNGFKQLTSNRALGSAASLRGLRVGIGNSRGAASHYRAILAIPVKTLAKDLYTDLVTGKIDAQENSLTVIVQQRLAEVQSQLTISNHACVEDLILVNDNFWQQTPKDLQVIIQGAIKDAAVYYRELTTQSNVSALEQLRRSGKIEVRSLTSQQKDAWRAEILENDPDFYQKIDKKLLKKTQNAALR